MRPFSRPGKDQRILYNGHKKVHPIKFQSVATPSGLVANLFGPVVGKRHDSSMLAESGLLNQLPGHQMATRLCIYEDPAYLLRPQLQAPFKGARITPIQNAWNKSMSSVRVSVEWIFGDIVNFFKFMDFKKNLKIQLTVVGKMYITCTLLQNAPSCLYGSTTSTFLKWIPQSLRNTLFN